MSVNVSLMHVLLARVRSEYRWPTGGTEHRPVFQPCWFQWMNFKDGLSLQIKHHVKEYINKQLVGDLSMFLLISDIDTLPLSNRAHAR